MLGCAGLCWALVGCIGLWWAVLCCAGLCWAIRGSTVLKPRHVHVKLLAVYTKSWKNYCPCTQWLIPCARNYRAGGSLEQHGGVCRSLVQSFASWSGLLQPFPGCNGLVQPSNYPPSLVYTPTGQDWAGLRCDGLYWALVGCAVLCCTTYQKMGP